MRIKAIPSRLTLAIVTTLLCAALLALIAGVQVAAVSIATAIAVFSLAALAVVDFVSSWREWRASDPKLSRRLPAAFAVGLWRDIDIEFVLQGSRTWQCRLYDHAPPTFSVQGMPAELELQPNKIVSLTYRIRPTLRGQAVFAPADIRVRSRWNLVELLDRIGDDEQRGVFPDFSQIARYAWLAGDRRLAEMGIKTIRQRGEGTDFKQLSEYQPGDAVRHIDWKATLRHQKPIVRQFQNERDQCVLLLIDCGRRMRADETQDEIGTSHFDQVLNASMLLSYVALKDGDAVGALTFGTPRGTEHWVAPRKGASALDTMMSELYAVQPTPTHSDYLSAARELLRRHRKRSLVILITNFRDEDSGELGQALRLLRTRHLVMTASLRERVIGELIEQPIVSQRHALDIASAHHYEQQRRDAFASLAARDSLMIDAEPERLGIELVNRYHSVKRSGLL